MVHPLSSIILKNTFFGPRPCDAVKGFQGAVRVGLVCGMAVKSTAAFLPNGSGQVPCRGAPVVPHTIFAREGRGVIHKPRAQASSGTHTTSKNWVLAILLLPSLLLSTKKGGGAGSEIGSGNEIGTAISLAAALTGVQNKKTFWNLLKKLNLD